jgi:cytochrome P450
MSALFLHSEIQNPYALYESGINEKTICYDQENNIWMAHSYSDCKAVLENPLFQIPTVSTKDLGPVALQIANDLVRLSNGQKHQLTRLVAEHLHQIIKPVSISEIMEDLFKTKILPHRLDWVDVIAKKIPVSVLLKGFGFDENESSLIADHTPDLVRIMLPTKTKEQTDLINTACNNVSPIIEKCIRNKSFFSSLQQQLKQQYNITDEEIVQLCVSNLVGLIIQSYDATRGLLTNSLHNLLSKKSDLDYTDKKSLFNSVIESLRFDPPIHTTRRIAVDTISIGDKIINSGEMTIVVLAAANRDPKIFDEPNSFKIERPNNLQLLSYGYGAHKCPADHFSINLTVDCLHWLFLNYPTVQLIQQQNSFEPLTNARLMQSLFINLNTL